MKKLKIKLTSKTDSKCTIGGYYLGVVSVDNQLTLIWEDEYGHLCHSLLKSWMVKFVN